MSSLRRRLFAILFDLAGIVERIARALLYLAAGTLTIDDLREAALEEYETFSDTDNDVAAGLLWWERNVYDRFLTSEDRILIVGAGSGRDVIALLEAGHDVVGLDALAAPLMTAERQMAARGLSALLIQGWMEDGVALPGTFDAVIFSLNCYSAVPESSRRVSALRQARLHLNPGGRVIVSHFEALGPTEQRAAAWARFSSRLTRSDWHPDRHDVLTKIGATGRVMHYHHVFAPEEIEAEAKAAGLRVVFHRHLPDPPTAVLTC